MARRARTDPTILPITSRMRSTVSGRALEVSLVRSEQPSRDCPVDVCVQEPAGVRRKTMIAWGVAERDAARNAIVIALAIVKSWCDEPLETIDGVDLQALLEQVPSADEE